MTLEAAVARETGYRQTFTNREKSTPFVTMMSTTCAGPLTPQVQRHYENKHTSQTSTFNPLASRGAIRGMDTYTPLTYLHISFAVKRIMSDGFDITDDAFNGTRTIAGYGGNEAVVKPISTVALHSCGRGGISVAFGPNLTCFSSSKARKLKGRLGNRVFTSLNRYLPIAMKRHRATNERAVRASEERLTT